MIIFTDFVSDESTTSSGKNVKTEVGWSLLAFLALNLALNMSLILRELVLKVIDWRKARRAEAKRLKKIEL